SAARPLRYMIHEQVNICKFFRKICKDFARPACYNGIIIPVQPPTLSGGDSMQLNVRYPSHPEDAKHYTTERLRRDFLIETVFQPDEAVFTYSHFDRIIAGGVMP